MLTVIKGAAKTKATVSALAVALSFGSACAASAGPGPLEAGGGYVRSADAEPVFGCALCEDWSSAPPLAALRFSQLPKGAEARFVADGTAGAVDSISRAAPAPEISTAAMASLGFLMLIVGGGRRARNPSWSAPWKIRPAA
jgi:hypothetical protein